jgi:predicted nuclease with TOPRIM domain
MTRISDERLDEIIFQCDYATKYNQFAAVSSADVAEVARELRMLRAENAKLNEYLEHQKECNRQSRKLISELEFVADKLREELSTLRKERFHASALLDCDAKLKVAVTAMKKCIDSSHYEASLYGIIADHLEKALRQIGVCE